MLVLNFAPVGFAMSDVVPAQMMEMPSSETSKPNKNTDRSVWSLYAEALNDAEAEEKILSLQSYKYPFIASQYGYAFKDQFAVPNERNYLPFEPPIV